MNKRVMVFIFLMIMSIDIYANDLSEAFNAGKYEGNIRLGYQSHEIENDIGDEFAAGVTFHYETGAYYGVQVGATLFTSHGNGKEGYEGVPFFDENNDNYAILGEVYLKGTFSNTVLTLGRQTFDTPFADSDDIGMVRNTFEAYTLVNTDIQDTILFMSYVEKWSGVDSPAPSRFTDINGEDGMQMLGITYEGIDKTILSGWFYNLSDEVKISYLEGNYEDETEKYTYGAALQYAYQDYESGESSTVYGVAAFLGVKKVGMTTTISYNTVDGIQADNFFGGGPFFTNAEHNTLREAGPDGDIILYTLEWDASVVGTEGLNIFVHIDMHQDDSKEYDFGMEYAYNDSVDFSAVFSDVEKDDDAFKNLRIFANYSF